MLMMMMMMMMIVSGVCSIRPTCTVEMEGLGNWDGRGSRESEAEPPKA